MIKSNDELESLRSHFTRHQLKSEVQYDIKRLSSYLIDELFRFDRKDLALEHLNHFQTERINK